MRRRILLSILLAVAVTACALGIPLGYTAVQIVGSLTRDDLVARAQRIAATLDDEIASGHTPDLARVAVAVPQDGRLVVRLPSTGELVHGPDPGSDPVTEQVPIVQQGTVTLLVPSGPMHTRQAQVAALVALVIVLTVGIGTGVATVTARRLSSPLRHVADRASRLGAGDFRRDGKRYDIGELDMVADALDTSARALAQLVQRERELVGDVSHQLRSRLTALQLRLENLALAHDGAPEEASADAREAVEQAERLSEVLDELLAAARAARALDAEPVDLGIALPKIADEWRDPLRAEGRALRMRLQDGLRVKVAPARLREVIGVLLDNAQRHGAGTVTVSTRKGDVTAVIEVSDQGRGVPDELIAHIFDRGVSGGGSTGLGLSLARALVDSDGGRLELSQARPAEFSVFLPVARADALPSVRWPSDPSPR
ncbi:signal transduction histidine kinase [Herbihabitans rhizosphaerae]|uniref:Signal transduction histidine-protein kinase/phosphatase MprB n=1 Tax=Herbihabitans rhizosphaerae TaxID=1872711 RepID=A0A4Q7KGB7_9PSEU|nr:ATP-binding protein [Herbihabitans rhizosphaerae]RZS33870.1 signal transduction histidine kinase [Herbihabitans rhizosphaerae]